MHPLGLTDDWADKLQGESFADDAAGITYEHYMQVRGLYCSCTAHRLSRIVFPAPEWYTRHAPLLHSGIGMHACFTCCAAHRHIYLLPWPACRLC
jgi:hypothetical protein